MQLPLGPPIPALKSVSKISAVQGSAGQGRAGHSLPPHAELLITASLAAVEVELSPLHGSADHTLPASSVLFG